MDGRRVIVGYEAVLAFALSSGEVRGVRRLAEAERSQDQSSPRPVPVLRFP